MKSKLQAKGLPSIGGPRLEWGTRWRWKSKGFDLEWRDV